MPDNKNTKTGFVDVEAHNKEVAAALLEQDRPKLTQDFKPAEEALDKLAAQVVKKNDEDTDEAKAAEEKAAADAAAAEKEAADKAAAEKAAGTPPPAAVDPAIAEKAAADAAKAAADKAATDKANDIFKDTPSLPPGASPKSTEAFAGIKIRAAQEISNRDAKIEELTKKIKEFETKLQNPVPPELEKELQDHRTWRAKLDVEADPKFKQFDQQADAAREFIYAQLKQSPVITDETIAQIKKLGGPENVNMAKIFEAVKDPVLQRLVEAKISDVAMAKFQKEQAIKAAKDNIQQYVAERTKAYQESVNSHTRLTQQRVDPLLGQLKWMEPKTAADTADAATKAEVEAHNKFVTETKQQIGEALKDDSPEMRAILLVGMAQLFNLQRTHEAFLKKFEAQEKELTEVKAKWEKVKGASVSRLRESAANQGARPAEPKPTLNTHTGDALDTIAKQVMEARERAATT